MVRIALVNTWKGNHPLLGLAYLPSYYKRYGKNNQEVRFRIIEASDESRVVEQLAKDKPDIVGFHSYTPNYKKVLGIARQLRAKLPNLVIIIGGPHISGFPLRLDTAFDAGFVGESEESFRRFVDGLIGNRMKLAESWLRRIKGICYHSKGSGVEFTGYPALIEPLDRIPLPARNLLDPRDMTTPGDVLSVQANLRGTSMLTSRGCPYNCVYCQSRAIFPKPRLFSAEYVVDEIELLYKTYRAEAISIDDDLFMISRSRLAKIVELLEKRGLLGKLRYNCSARANLITEEIVPLLKRMGVVQAQMGFETGSERMLKYMKKNTVTQADHQRALRLLSEAGIWVYASFMLGTPTETEAEMEETLRLMSDKRIRMCTVNITTPLPGTDIWDIAREKGMVSEDMDWDRFFNSQDRPESQIYINEIVPHDRFLKIFKRAQDIILSKSAGNWGNLNLMDMVEKFLRHPRNNLRFAWNHKGEALGFVMSNLANSLRPKTQTAKIPL